MSYDLQFVDSISASPTVRLDLGLSPWTVRSSTEFGMAELRRSVVSTMMADGDRYPAAAYGNRMITLVLRVDAATDDAEAAVLQSLFRELDRPTNVLRYRPNTTSPVFFRTFRATPSSVTWDPVEKAVVAQIPAEPFALGLKETLGPYTVKNDPAATSADLNANPYFETNNPVLNANPFFETNVSDWTATGGTFARSTAQFHEGVASGLLTPDGVSATTRVENIASSPASPGQVWRASAWMRCAVARTVNLEIGFYDGSNSLLSRQQLPVNVAATTWTLFDFSGTAPASTAAVRISAAMFSTPPTNNTLHIDEAKLQRGEVPNWTATNGTFAQSGAQFHQGSASGLLSPSGVSSPGVESEKVPVTPGGLIRGSMWLRSATGTPSFRINIKWWTAAGAAASTALNQLSFGVSANTWTEKDFGAHAPADATQASLQVLMDTATTSDLLYIDEARLRAVGDGGANGCYFDATGIKGDVETPVILRIPTSDVGTNTQVRYSYIAVRRRGNPVATPFLLQVESMTDPAVDTTTQANDPVMSGGGGNYKRTTFAVGPETAKILTYTHPTSTTTDSRGRYRPLMRYRHSVAADVINAYLRWGGGAQTTVNAFVTNATVQLQTDTNRHYIDLDEMAIPYGPDPRYDGLSGVELPVAPATVVMFADRVSGTGTADWDCILLVPSDDRLAMIKWNADDVGVGGLGFPLPDYVYLDGTNRSIYWGKNGQIWPRPPTELDGDLPLISPGVVNRIFFILNVNSATQDDITDTTEIQLSYYPRYLYVAPVGS